jgi:hypothetical protein
MLPDAPGLISTPWSKLRSDAVPEGVSPIQVAGYAVGVCAGVEEAEAWCAVARDDVALGYGSAPYGVAGGVAGGPAGQPDTNTPLLVALCAVGRSRGVGADEIAGDPGVLGVGTEYLDRPPYVVEGDRAHDVAGRPDGGAVKPAVPVSLDLHHCLDVAAECVRVGRGARLGVAVDDGLGPPGRSAGEAGWSA